MEENIKRSNFTVICCDSIMGASYTFPIELTGWCYVHQKTQSNSMCRKADLM